MQGRERENLTTIKTRPQLVQEGENEQECRKWTRKSNRFQMNYSQWQRLLKAAYLVVNGPQELTQK